MNDCIDRQAAIDAIEKLILPQTKGETMAEEINRVAWRCAINCAEEIIGHLPSAEVEPVKRGKWVNVNPTVDSVQCSNCGYQVQLIELATPYCPWCGARMVSEKEGADHE